MAKYIAQVVITGAQIIGRAFVKAVQSEVRASQQAAQARSGGKPNVKSAAADSVSGITLQEAKQILHINDINDAELLKKNFDHLFAVNDKSKGGSFYLQSKVANAKERIDQERQLQSNKSAEKETRDRTRDGKSNDKVS